MVALGRPHNEMADDIDRLEKAGEKQQDIPGTRRVVYFHFTLRVRVRCDHGRHVLDVAGVAADE